MPWAELVDLVQPGADDGSRLLAEALRQVNYDRAQSLPQKFVAEVLARYHDGLTRAIAGDAVADDLGLGNHLWKYAIPFTRVVLTPFELLRESIPGATYLSALAGNFVWTNAVKQELGGRTPSFKTPKKPRFERRFRAAEGA